MDTDLQKRIEDLRKYLPRGYGDTIASKCDCTATHVYGCVKGRYKNPSPLILLAIIELAESNKKNMQEVEARLRNFQG